MSEIIIEVTPEVAAAYQSASLEDRKKIQSVVSILLQKQTDNEVALLHQLMDEISDQARGRGLTPEILESVLNE